VSARRGIGLLAVLVATLAFGHSARADVFGPISLASENPAQQAEYARDAAISADGRYLAFDGSFGGSTGVWRRDLQSGAVEAVAGGDAERPSISADGRYISFTTTARLNGVDHNENPDVYVRDMELHSSESCSGPEPEGGESPCPFALASAVDGGVEALSYGASSEAAYGSVAGGRTALSADGRKVAFVTTAVSDLLGPRPPQAPSTPAMQVALRDLDTRSTQLVSVKAGSGEEPQPVAAVEAGLTLGAAWPLAPQKFTAVESYGGTPAWGASLSADGSTVAWLGVNVGEQASFLAGEAPIPRYTEPLWRRIGDGPLAPTLRVTGGSDPGNGACLASGETALPQRPVAGNPCQGPFDTQFELSTPGTWLGGSEGNFVPQLSADGYKVAFLANAPLVALGANFERSTFATDIYLADMHPGPTRAQALRPLSELASGNTTDLATNAPIVDLGISADGSQLAFATKRTVFPLGLPAFVSPPAPIPGMGELFEADLADETLTRVTHGYEGGASEHPHPPVPTGQDPYIQAGDGALSPSFSGDGQTLAFASTADNLVYGDGNTPPAVNGSQTFDGSDAFVTSRVQFGSAAAQQYISPPPGLPPLRPTWRLFTTAQSRRDGTVVLRVRVPSSGKLLAAARGSVRVLARSGSSARRRPTRVTSATVATRTAGLRAAGLTTVVLRLAPRYSSLARRRGGFAATVALTFSASEHGPLHARIAVTFVRAKRAHRRGAR
jgi:hypothetical protein